METNLIQKWKLNVWTWLQVQIILTGILATGMFVWIQAFNGPVRIQLPSIADTCFFDETYSTPVKKK